MQIKKIAMLDPGPADIAVKVLDLRTYNAKQFLTLSQVFAKIFASCKIQTLVLPNQTMAIVLISRMTTAVGFTWWPLTSTVEDPIVNE